MENKYEKYQERLLPRHQQRVGLYGSSGMFGIYYPLIKWGKSTDTASWAEEEEIIQYLDNTTRKMRPLVDILDDFLIREHLKDINNGDPDFEYSENFRKECLNLIKLFDNHFMRLANEDLVYDSKRELYDKIMYGIRDYWIPNQVRKDHDYFKSEYKPLNIVKLFEQEILIQTSADYPIHCKLQEFELKLIIQDFALDGCGPLYISNELALDFIQDAIEHFTRDSHPVFRVLLARHYFNHNFRTIDEDLDLGFDFESDFAESTINPNVVSDRITQNKDGKS